jgi:hypothetical protein
MTLSIIFLVSGVVVAMLVSAKHIEMRTRRPLILLSLISKGDTQVRELSQYTTHTYSELKDKTAFFIEKQLPLHSKNLYNKSKVYLRDEFQARIGDIRGSRLLKKPDGISEFFRNMAEIEKGGGEINDTAFEAEIK